MNFRIYERGLFLLFLVLISNVFAAPKPHLQPSVPKPIPQVPTNLRSHPLMGNSLTAGDVIELEVSPPQDLIDASPDITDIDHLPVVFGTGRILWVKPYDPKTGFIVLGLTSYTPGKFEITSIPFKKNEHMVFTTQPQSIDFTSLSGDKSKDDIYPPVSVAVPTWVWMATGLLSLILAIGILWGIWIWIRKWQQRKFALSKIKRPLTPLEEFENTKAKTLEKGFLLKALYKPHYFSLSDASKRFLGKSFHFDAEERTTRELVQDLQSFGLSENLISQWKNIFDEMDITKFTDQIPIEKTAKTLAIRLSSLVVMTYKSSPEAQKSLISSQKGVNRAV